MAAYRLDAQALTDSSKIVAGGETDSRKVFDVSPRDVSVSSCFALVFRPEELGSPGFGAGLTAIGVV